MFSHSFTCFSGMVLQCKYCQVQADTHQIMFIVFYASSGLQKENEDAG